MNTTISKFFNKHRTINLIVCCVLLAVLLLNLLYYQSGSTVGKLTETCMTEAHCTVTGENVMFSREQLSTFLANPSDTYNQEYYQKFSGMLNKQKIYYVLSPQVYMELYLSGGDEATVRKNWEELKYQTIMVSKDGSFESTNSISA